jgi:hypothetical protein
MLKYPPWPQQKSHPDMTRSLRSSAVVLLPVLLCAEGINPPSSFLKASKGTFPRSILCEKANSSFMVQGNFQRGLFKRCSKNEEEKPSPDARGLKLPAGKENLLRSLS